LSAETFSNISNSTYNFLAPLTSSNTEENVTKETESVESQKEDEHSPRGDGNEASMSNKLITPQRLAAVNKSLTDFSARMKDAATTAAAKIKVVVEEEQKSLKEAFDSLDAESEASRQHNERMKRLPPPWINIPLEDLKERAEVESLIKGMPPNRKNFLNAPPDDACFSFDFDEDDNMALAQVCLRADPRLAQMRFRLVPSHISEKGFWRNYFYRIYVIKKSYGVKDEYNNYGSITKEGGTYKREDAKPLAAASSPAAARSPAANRVSTDYETSTPSTTSKPLFLPPQDDTHTESGEATEELEFVSDNFADEFSAANNIVDEETEAKEAKPEASAWESDWNQLDDEALDVEIDEEWEAEMRRELELNEE